MQEVLLSAQAAGDSAERSGAEVLAVQAVEGAGLKEDGQVGVSPLRSTMVSPVGVAGAGSARANPVGHAICGQGIVIPGKPSLAGRHALQPAPYVLANPAVPQSAFGYNSDRP